MEIVSDNDVRFSPPGGFWRNALRNLGIKVPFTQPRHPQSNGLCERTNRKFLQQARILMQQQGSRDWLRLVPIITWIINSQWNPQTGYTPQELFFGRPGYKPEFAPEPETNPMVETWILEQKALCEMAEKRLQIERAKRIKKKQTKAEKIPFSELEILHWCTKNISTMGSIKTRKPMVWAISNQKDPTSNRNPKSKSRIRGRNFCGIHFSEKI